MTPVAGLRGHTGGQQIERRGDRHSEGLQFGLDGLGDDITMGLEGEEAGSLEAISSKR